MYRPFPLCIYISFSCIDNVFLASVSHFGVYIQIPLLYIHPVFPYRQKLCFVISPGWLPPLQIWFAQQRASAWWFGRGCPFAFCEWHRLRGVVSWPSSHASLPILGAGSQFAKRSLRPRDIECLLNQKGCYQECVGNALKLGRCILIFCWNHPAPIVYGPFWRALNYIRTYTRYTYRHVKW